MRASRANAFCQTDRQRSQALPGCQMAPAEVLKLWETDVELNSQGLDVWLDASAK